MKHVSIGAKNSEMILDEGRRRDLEFVTIPRLVLAAAERHDTRAAIVDGEVTLSFAGLASEVASAARALVARGIEHGEFRRLRRCVNCGKWLFAGRRRDKTNCSERCRQARYERTPKRQASNPVRAAEYYRRTLKSYRKRSKKER